MKLLRFPLIIAAAMAVAIGACDDNADEASVDIDRTWDSTDQAFDAAYVTVKARHDSLQNVLQTMPASDANDTVATARRTEAQSMLEQHNQRLQEIENQRSQARQSRESAKSAGDAEAYRSAADQARANYDAWRADLDRIRNEQTDLEGRVFIGNAEVGSVDGNANNPDEPLLRVEPGKPDDKPLIEMNKNPDTAK